MLNSVAFIPDGNRRYAKKSGISLLSAYRAGFSKAKEALEWSLDTYDINEATIWTLSTENLMRNRTELHIFLKLLELKLKGLVKDSLVHDRGIKVKIIGKQELLPPQFKKIFQEVVDATKDYTNCTLNLAIGYGGRTELVDAVNKLILQGKPVTEATFAQALYLEKEPDLVIRTGGTQRLSGFLPWQSAYSELYFSEKLWPEFTKQDFNVAVDEFNARERRYGK